MVQAPSKAIALEDFLRMPETKPASEYIDGQKGMGLIKSTATI